MISNSSGRFGWTIKASGLALVSLGVFAGCGSNGRTPNAYRDDTTAVIEQTNAAVTDCYTAILKSGTPTAQGSVTVRFTVEGGSGRFRDAKLDLAQSTAPDAVQQCVMTALAQVRLSPADPGDADGRFVWDFKFHEPLPVTATTTTAAPVPASQSVGPGLLQPTMEFPPGGGPGTGQPVPAQPPAPKPAS